MKSESISDAIVTNRQSDT
jgi:hypothetical protein